LTSQTGEACIRALSTALAVRQDKIAGTSSQTLSSAKPRDIVLYGFGRIGRLVARVLIEKTGAGSKMVLRAIVVRPKPDDLKKRVNLLLQDSVHGRFDGVVTFDEETKTITANGNVIQVRYCCYAPHAASSCSHPHAALSSSSTPTAPLRLTTPSTASATRL